MTGSVFVIKVSPADHASFGVGLAEEIALRANNSSLNITISDDPTITERGLIVQDAEGRQIWDNRLPQRLDRLWPQLRRQLAVQSSLVAEDHAAGSLGPANRPALPTKSSLPPASQASHAGQEPGGDRGKGCTNSFSPVLGTGSGGGAK
jgi:hypothetical protein